MRCGHLIIHTSLQAARVEEQTKQEAGFFGRVWGTAQSEKQRVLSEVPVLSAGLMQTLWSEVQRKQKLAADVSDVLPQDFTKMLVDFSLGRGSILLRTYDAQGASLSSSALAVATQVNMGAAL
jgi:hypothetical protein